MPICGRPAICALALTVMIGGCALERTEGGGEAAVIRVATFNVEDVRTEDLDNPGHPRLQAAAALIQRLAPDVLLVNEIAYDQPGAPGYRQGEPAGQNGRRLAERFLSVPQNPELEGIVYQAFMAPSNTGLFSGFDLDNDGTALAMFPAPPTADSSGAPGPQTPEGRAYGGDTWGFGTFPGQYGMALLVRDGLEILESEVRTFQRFPWSRLPGALLPVDPSTGEAWYSPEEWLRFPLSSKSHWDVPVRLPGGEVIHFLCSHPTPPAFDGPEERNRRRNHDEIRFWSEYLDGASFIVDDSGDVGGLEPGAYFVVLGDLNADPNKGSSLHDPIGRFLIDHPLVLGELVPEAEVSGSDAYVDLEPDDTARWGMRVDYVLPSRNLKVLGAGVWRDASGDAPEVSDHFPVWIDVAVPSRL